MQKMVQKLTKENEKLKQEVSSQKQEIEILRRNLRIKDMLLKESDHLKNDAREVLEEMKAEQDRMGKKISKHLEKLKGVEPPIKEVGMYHAESLESVLPKSTSEYSESKGSELEWSSLVGINQTKLNDYDKESDHGSSIRSDTTVINNQLSSVPTIRSPIPRENEHNNADIDTHNHGADKKEGTSPIDEYSDKQSDTTGTVPRSDRSISFPQPTGVQSSSDGDFSDTTGTVPRSNRSISFPQPTGVQSPSDGDFSDGQVVRPRHTKEIAMSPLSPLSQQLEQHKFRRATSLASPKPHGRTITHTPQSQQSAGDCEYMTKFREITSKRQQN